MFKSWSDARPVAMMPGLTRRTLGVGEKVLMAEFRLTAGTVVQSHSHPYEQVGYVASGRMRFTVGSEEHVMEPGDVYVAVSGEPHGATCLEDAVMVEVFAPPRDDFKT